MRISAFLDRLSPIPRGAAYLLAAALAIGCAPEAPPWPDPPTQITVGDGHACVLLASRRVACWGENGNGQCGSDETVVHRPHIVPGLERIVRVVAGSRWTCAIREDAAAFCWGRNAEGELGAGSEAYSLNTPVRLALDVVHDIAFQSGLNVRYAIGGDGHVYEWSPYSLPTRADSEYSWWLRLENVVAFAPPQCVQTADGITVCPRLESGAAFERVASMSASGDGATCLVQDGTVFCAGGNDYGQLGDGSVGEWSPGFRSSLTSAEVVRAADEHTCATRQDGTVWCWGNNGAGQLGTGDRVDSVLPRQVAGLRDITDFDIENMTNCAIRSDSTVWCWGWMPGDDLVDAVVPEFVSPPR